MRQVDGGLGPNEGSRGGELRGIIEAVRVRDRLKDSKMTADLSRKKNRTYDNFELIN